MSAQRVLFIGGLGRSGSTLIEKLLNELPETLAVGETIHLWERGIRDQERCGCGEPFQDCPHWTAVGDDAFGGWDHVPLERVIDLRWSVDRSRQLPSILWRLRRRRMSAAQTEYLNYLRSVLLAGARTAADNPVVLLESSKHLSTAALLAADPELDVRVLHLLRDPRGVAYSWTKDVDRPEAGPDAKMPQYRPERTAIRWVTDNLGFRLLSRLGVPTLTMRYEDVLDAPAASLAKIAGFMGLNLEDNGFRDGAPGFLVGNEAQLQTPMHSVAGNPLRFGGDRITLRLDNAWHEHLDRRSQRIVSVICAPAMRFFGYRIRAR